jgi:hypothetical protein
LKLRIADTWLGFWKQRTGIAVALFLSHTVIYDQLVQSFLECHTAIVFSLVLYLEDDQRNILTEESSTLIEELLLALETLPPSGIFIIF